MIEPPLKSVSVLAVEQYGAGPFGTLFLATMGAEAIKVDDPTAGGDVSRGFGPHFIADSNESDASLFYQGLNHNKKSIALDIGSKDGHRVFQELAGTADVAYTNLRGDVPEKLNLTYDRLKQYNEQLVCAHLSGYGPEVGGRLRLSATHRVPGREKRQSIAEIGCQFLRNSR
jgi:crotonobetainyl-CoA:carnitine CoA-transferase CaiB-like acyl-CoA transferase